MAGLARIVLYRRERPVVIEPLGKGMLLTTLRYGDTVRKADAIFEDIKSVQVDNDMMDLATTVIEKKKGKFDPSTFQDSYENALLDLIKSKKKSRKVPKAKAGSKSSNVVNLFDALKKSLASDQGARRTNRRKRPPAKKAPASTRKRQRLARRRRPSALKRAGRNARPRPPIGEVALGRLFRLMRTVEGSIGDAQQSA